MSGLRPSTTPIGEWCDAVGAALYDIVEPSEDESRGKRWMDALAYITGDDTPATPTADAAADSTDRATEQVIRELPEDEMSRWVPAFSKSDYSDAQFDQFWTHTASFAAGQAALMNMAGAPADAAGPPADNGGGE